MERGSGKGGAGEEEKGAGEEGGRERGECPPQEVLQLENVLLNGLDPAFEPPLLVLLGRLELTALKEE